MDQYVSFRDCLFEWEGRKCTKAHFQSLQDNKLVETTVLDTWTYLLNKNEILKADSSPLRLFMTTEATYRPLRMDVGIGDDYSKMSHFAAFDDNMDLVMKMVNEIHNKQYDVKDFDMTHGDIHGQLVCLKGWPPCGKGKPTSTAEKIKNYLLSHSVDKE
ncbi:hypothetical protein AgCh_020438 [Apium graveolens]